MKIYLHTCHLGTFNPLITVTEHTFTQLASFLDLVTQMYSRSVFWKVCYVFHYG